MIPIFIACVWSSILIYSWMVHAKYYWTLPPQKIIILFSLAGIVSTVLALLCNVFLSRETEFWILSSNKLKSFMGFFIGAGLGEEFCKMACGVSVVIILSFTKTEQFLHIFLPILRKLIRKYHWYLLVAFSSPYLCFIVCYSLIHKHGRIRDVDCILGCVSLGLVFGSVENLFTYHDLLPPILVTRGLMAIPLHAGMGMIHGITINQARREKRVMPLLKGYGVAVLIHTLYDTSGIFLSDILAKIITITIVIFLVVWMITTWKNIQEVEPPYLLPEQREYT